MRRGAEADQAALRLSMQYGNGNPKAFNQLDRESQILWLVWDTRDQKPKAKSDSAAVLQHHLAEIERRRAKGAG